MADDVEMQAEAANMMDEAIKDRTVTWIAAISIVVVGLLGLWVISGALRASGLALPWDSQNAASLQLSSTPQPVPQSPSLPTDQRPLPITPAVTGAAGSAESQAGVVHITGEQQPAVATHTTPPATEADSTEVFSSQPLIPAKKNPGSTTFWCAAGRFQHGGECRKVASENAGARCAGGG